MPRQQSNQDDPLATAMALYKMFGPDAESETSLKDAQTRDAVARAAHYESLTNAVAPQAAAELAKTQAETGEVQQRGKELGAQSSYNQMHAHMLTSQMLQQMFPDQPNIARDYITNASMTDPNLAAVRPALEKMVELPKAVNRIRTGQAQPGDEDLVGGTSPVALAAARAEALKHRAPTTGTVVSRGPNVVSRLVTHLQQNEPQVRQAAGLPTIEESQGRRDDIWNFLFGQPVTQQ